MLQPRGTETSQLVHLIEVIQLGRKTGILIVARGKDSHREAGEITFFQGTITQARARCEGIANVLNGQRALAWLHTWGPCWFNFVIHSSSASEGRVTQPTSTTRHRGMTQPLRDTQSRLPVPYISSPPGATKPLYLATSNNNPAFNDSAFVPRRIAQIEEGLRLVDSVGFSRIHRQFLLLIDGHRNIADLIRLTSRSQEEARKILQDLVNIGVIR